MNYSNNSIPEFVPRNLKWYEIDGLMTYIDKLKYSNFLKDTGGHFKRTQIINFDIIHKQARGEKTEPDLVKEYKTIDNSMLKYYPKTEKNKAFLSVFRSSRKDIFFK